MCFYGWSTGSATRKLARRTLLCLCSFEVGAVGKFISLRPSACVSFEVCAHSPVARPSSRADPADRPRGRLLRGRANKLTLTIASKRKRL